MISYHFVINLVRLIDVCVSRNVSQNGEGGTPPDYYFTKGHNNKAVYMTVSVAYEWAGALMRFRYPFGKNFNSVTDRLTD